MIVFSLPRSGAPRPYRTVRSGGYKLSLSEWMNPFIRAGYDGRIKE
jgi:hypothetical protein